MMTKKSDKKRKASLRREDNHTRELRTKNREDFQAGPSNKQKRSVPTEAQNRSKRMRELDLQQDFRRGFEDPEDEEDVEDAEDEATEDDDIDDTPVQRGSARQLRKQVVKKVLTRRAFLTSHSRKITRRICVRSRRS